MKPAAVALAVSKVGAGGTARLLTELMLVQDKKCTSVVSLIEYLYTALLSSHVLLRRRQLPLAMHVARPGDFVLSESSEDERCESGVYPVTRTQAVRGRAL